MSLKHNLVSCLLRYEKTMSRCNSLCFTQIRRITYKRVISWYSGLIKPKVREPPFGHIIQVGDPRLRTRCEPVPQSLVSSPEMKFLLKRMRNVMKQYNCVGLSAPQVGIPIRVFMVELTQKQLEEYTREERQARCITQVPYTVVINPVVKVLDYSKVTFSENCESVKGFTADVARFGRVELRGVDENGGDLVVDGRGWLGRIIQHEMDHLNGALYTDIMDKKTLACCCWQAVNERGGKVELPYGRV